MKKINIFLGGFINLTNAQNLNCLSLAKYLNKDKFNIYSLELYSGNLDSQKKAKIKGLKIFSCFYPAKISMYLGFLWGIYKCDIAYLPKRELWRWNHFLLNILNKKSFSTIEGIFDEENLKSAMIFDSYHKFLKSKKIFNELYAITNFLAIFNKKNHNINFNPKTLYLGCEINKFKNTIVKNKGLNKVIFIGRLEKRKGIYDFLEITSHFTDIEFIIFGNGPEKKAIEELIKKQKRTNIALMGLVNHYQLAKILEKIDLHILPSRSEGFPKVTLETAAAGVPSLVYSDYGANEWITHNKDGWIVKTIEEMIQIIKELKSKPKLLELNSNNARNMAEKFNWHRIIKEWEKEITNLYHEQKK